MAKKMWAVNVTWMMGGTDYVEANTMEEAMAIAADPSRPLPEDRSYINNSLTVEGAQEKKEDDDEGCC